MGVITSASQKDFRAAFAWEGRARCLAAPRACGDARPTTVAPERFPSNKIEKQHKEDEGDHGQNVRPRAIEEWVVPLGPLLPVVEAFLPGDDHEGEEDTRESAAGDVTGCEKDAVALVTFGDELIFGERGAGVLAAGIFVDQPAHHPADENRPRRWRWEDRHRRQRRAQKRRKARAESR